MSDTPENALEAPEQKPEVKSDNAGSNFYKQKINVVSEENAQLKAQLEMLKEAQLKEKENYKELADVYKKKADEAETKSKKVMDSYFNGLKISAIKEQALKLGIREEALEDLPLIDHSAFIEVETTSTGNANVLGAKEFIETLKEKKPYWFLQAKAPNINTNGINDFKEKMLTASDLLKLEKTDPAKYKEEVLKRLAKK